MFDTRMRTERHTGNLPAVPLRIDSPYDIEARYCIKCSTEWVGYKVHFRNLLHGVPHLVANDGTTARHEPDVARGS
jgi:hypothetical protein